MRCWLGEDRGEKQSGKNNVQRSWAGRFEDGKTVKCDEGKEMARRTGCLMVGSGEEPSSLGTVDHKMVLIFTSKAMGTEGLGWNCYKIWFDDRWTTRNVIKFINKENSKKYIPGFDVLALHWKFFHLCLWGILVYSFLFLYCLYLFLVSSGWPLACLLALLSLEIIVLKANIQMKAWASTLSSYTF